MENSWAAVDSALSEIATLPAVAYEGTAKQSRGKWQSNDSETAVEAMKFYEFSGL